MNIPQISTAKLNNNTGGKKLDATTKAAATQRYPQAPPREAGYSSDKGTAGKSLAEKGNRDNQLPKPKPSQAQAGRGNVAAAFPKKRKMDLETLVSLCQKGASEVKGSETENAKATNKFLWNIYRLNRQAALSPDAKKAQDRVIRNAGIKISKNTDEFTALLKSFLGKKCPRSTVSRCSNALQYARKNKIELHEFVDFVQYQGGTAECARKMAKERKTATNASSSTEEKTRKIIKERLIGAPKYKAPSKTQAFEKGFGTLFVKTKTDGSFFVLGSKSVPASAVRSYSRLKAKPVSPVAKKRP